jgi:imidazolonepropionase-like amidohydrolase
VIDEAHKHGMLVHAHAIALADQKAVVRAGADVLVHIVASEKIDDELQALVRERKAVLDACAGGWETGARFATRIRFVDQALPGEAIAAIRRESCGTPGAGAAMREEMLAYNFPRMIAAGARIVLGTDAGIVNRYSFGWADHHESSRYVQLGLTPAEAIVAATRRAAELMGIQDMGALETGKSADFVVLNANPLDAITNTRQIAMVVLRGKPIDRASLLAKWKRAR